MTTTTYRHTLEMGEISGFGGTYEECCQDMLEAGVSWLQGHENIYGLVNAASPQTEQLEKAVLGACDDATGAMHHAVMDRLMYIAQHGWEMYRAELEEAGRDQSNGG